MFETLGFDTLTAPQAAVWFALLLGLAFGALAQITRFCFRRMIDGEDRKQAAGVWLTALAVAVLGTQAAVAQGWIGFADHRFMAQGLPVLAIVVGGLMFGAGMILTRGCISRLTVLSGTGNLRAALVLVVFAVVAHATLKGVLAPVRTGLGSVTLDVAPALPGAGLVWAVVIALAAIGFALRSGNRAGTLALAALLGALVPLAWVGTGFVLYDEFEPIAMESLSFTSPATETLFYAVASTAVAPGFGLGLIGGVVLGALAAALIRGQFTWQSFDSPRQTGRYMAGAALMGVGGVLAGGCTVGAGLSGIPTLSLAAILAIAAIAAGGWITRAALNAATAGAAGSATTQAALPAE
ncbi:Sulphur transport [Lutimaribacter pacificus]|uniref:Sulphur transport n=1 Tax=Lutimaribacter pacificus TaxID=391948 RepID=A0A1H0B492_9RHOB|nr:YeeE/YedE family protein [Lutimaribacter pacificus]SDN40425.1 Sulphur transport [Lutimaribacter pacificus]SHJ60691.1 Sulphur transport [Lutimaribacter pacificus]